MLPFPVGVDDIKDTPVHILPEHKRRHIAVFGKSGVGKTTLLHNMIVWDVYHGLGVTVLDPHGSLVDSVLENIPRQRTNDVIVFRPSDPEHVLGLNLLEPVPEAQKPLLVSALISIFKTLWAESWGPRSEYILRGATFALLAQREPVSLLSLMRFFADDGYRRRIREQVTDPATQSFLSTYDDIWNARFRDEATSPIINKLDAFVSNPLLRAVIGQTRSSFDFRRVMDSGQILLCDLSKGALGGDVSSLLGSLIVTKLSLAALAREDMSEDDRRLHVLYADEVQNFTYGVDFPTVLAEARKYALALTIATQTLSQLPRVTRSAVLGNCGTYISYRVSGEDADVLTEEFATTLPGSVIQDLPDYRAYVRTMLTDAEGVGKPKEARPVRAHPAIDAPMRTSRERVVRESIRRFGRPRKDVEAWMKRFLA